MVRRGGGKYELYGKTSKGDGKYEKSNGKNAGEKKGSLEELLEKIRIEMEEERRKREEERKREKEEWKKEREELENRIEELEKISERRDREDRKKNIVIKGLKWRRERVNEEVEQFIKENLNIEVGVENAYRLKINQDKEVVIAILDNWKQKREVMSKKKELRQGIWIEDDLTMEERRVQNKLRERAREERAKGNKVKIGYRKLFIGDKVVRWNEKVKELEEGRKNE